MIKKYGFIIILLLSEYRITYADAFPKSLEDLGGPVLSLELIGCFEYGFADNGSVLLWGGGAAVFSPFGLSLRGGPEAAVELRHYFVPKKNKIWSVSFYSGVAYNFIGEQYGAFTPGLKLTRKKTISPLIKSEPYISLSYPFYFEGGHPLLPFLTFGYRFVFEKKVLRYYTGLN
jgi:hypothetical protein